MIKKEHKGGHWTHLCYMFLVIVLMEKILFQAVLVNAWIPSESMENTIRPGDRVIATRFDRTEVQRGDIVIFKQPDDPKQMLIKRLIGMPGDSVQIRKDGTVWINGKKIEEPYLKEAMIVEEEQSFEVPKDCYFFLGDNRNDSFDARYWETPYVSKENLVGKAKCIFFPLQHIRGLQNEKISF